LRAYWTPCQSLKEFCRSSGIDYNTIHEIVKENKSFGSNPLLKVSFYYTWLPRTSSRSTRLGYARFVRPGETKEPRTVCMNEAFRTCQRLPKNEIVAYGISKLCRQVDLMVIDTSLLGIPFHI